MAVDSGTVQVVMPAMGDSVAEGTVLEWHKGVGDTVEVDETIVEISTDKVDTELPAPASGTITEILFGEGDTVTVGQVIARMEAAGATAVAARIQPKDEANAADARAATTVAPASQPATAGDGATA